MNGLVGLTAATVGGFVVAAADEALRSGDVVQSSYTILLSVLLAVVAYFLKRFVDSVQELSRTVSNLRERVAVIEATAGIQAPEAVGALEPPRTAHRPAFSRHRDG